MMNLVDLIDLIKKRPGMYIGKCEIDRLYLYIAGFIICLKLNNLNDDFLMNYQKYFNFFVQFKVIRNSDEIIKRKLRFNNGMSFVQLIPFIEKDTQKQIDFYFECFDEFKKLYDQNYDFEPIKEKFM